MPGGGSRPTPTSESRNIMNGEDLSGDDVGRMFDTTAAVPAAADGLPRKPGHRRATPSHRRSRAVTVGALTLGLVLIGTGGVLGFRGIHGTPEASTATAVPAAPGPAPLPDAPFQVSPEALAPLPPVADPTLDPVPPVPTLTTAPAAVPGVTNAGSTDAGPAGGTGPFGGGCADTPRSGQIVIASLCVNAQIVPTVIDGDNSLVIPADVRQVGLWVGGPGVVAATGTTVIAGHVDDARQGPGALNQLHNVAPGAVVWVTDTSGQVTRWQVTDVAVVDKAALPDSVFAGAAGPRRLDLVTCGGPLLHLPDGHGGTYGTYQDNIVVTAVPA